MNKVTRCGFDETEYAYIGFIEWIDENGSNKYVVIQYGKSKPNQMEVRNGMFGIHLEYCGQGCSAYNAIDGITVNDKSIALNIAIAAREDIEVDLICIPVTNCLGSESDEILQLLSRFIELDGNKIRINR